MQCVQSSASNSKTNLSQPNGNSLNLIAWPFKCIRRRCQTSPQITAIHAKLAVRPLALRVVVVIFHWLNQATRITVKESWHLGFNLHNYRRVFLLLLSLCRRGGRCCSLLGPFLLYYACGLYVFFICHVVLIGKPKLKLSLKNHNTTDDASSKMCPTAASGRNGCRTLHLACPLSPLCLHSLSFLAFALHSVCTWLVRLGGFWKPTVSCHCVHVMCTCVCVWVTQQQQ